MTVSLLSPMSFTAFYNAAIPGPVQVNLYFYTAGTLDPISVYSDAGLSIPYEQPVRSGGSGRVPPVWIGELTGGYRVRVFDQFSVLLEDTDNLPGAVNPDIPDPTPVPDNRLAQTGDVIWAFSNSQPRSGCVLANGASVGSALSPATGRANDDTEALFKWLWQQDIPGLLAVIPSRGASADSDWAANKAIATPNLMGRAAVGMDAMGVPAQNRLAGVIFATGGQAVLGSTGGLPTRALTATELPNHTHAVYDPGHAHTGWTGGHSHTIGVTVNGVGDHGHAAWTDVQGDHAHSYDGPGENITHLLGGGFAVTFSGPLTGRTTTVNGNHSHNVGIGGGGAHSHSASGWASAVGDIGVGIAAAATSISLYGTGGGAAFDQTQPFMTLCVYLHL